MSFFGVDLGSLPDRTAIIATSSVHEWTIGERIWGLGSNRYVSRILCAIGTSAEIVTHRRPTRGYARHIRRQKQRARR